MIVMTLLTSQLVNVAICVLLAAYKRYPILLWALLGTLLPVVALSMLLQRRVELLALLCVSLLPFVLTVYLLQGPRFARPLLIAFSIYSLPLGLGLMTGLGTRAWPAESAT
jgi:hypothetical protein